MSDGPQRVAEVEAAVRGVSRALTAHAGGVELVSVQGGTARLRFTGACTGCPARPMTFAATVRPRLLGHAGLDRVEAEGVRLDEEQETRLRAWQQAGDRLAAGGTIER